MVGGALLTTGTSVSVWAHAAAENIALKRMIEAE
jgi:hypothetical protein